jgi:ATP-dependent exoDNAse (exonuclease V) beta subunit
MNNETIPYPYTHKDLYDAATTTPCHNTSVEWSYFLNYVKDTAHLKPYRTEWTIYDEELKIAGSIDMVYEKPNGTLAIYDWKRSKDITRVNNFNKFALTECICHMPDSNFWHYALQLNTYKAILERQYGKIVTDLYLVRLHPNNPRKTFDLIKCADLSQEITDLFQLRKEQIQL